MSEQPAESPGRGRRIVRNFGFMSAGKFLGDIFTFLFFIVLARAFGDEGIGQYSFAMALTGVLVVFADYGLFRKSVKEMSRSRSSIAVYYGRLLAIRLILSCIVLFLMVIAVWLLPLSASLKQVILLIGCYQVFVTLLQGFGAVFVATEDMHLTGFFEFVHKTVIALAGILIVMLGGSLIFTLTALPLTALIMTASVYMVTRRKIGAMPLSVTAGEFRDVLVESFPYAMYILMSMLSARVALILLGFMVGAAAAGVFNAAYRVIFVLLFIPVFSGWAIFPLASRMYSGASAELGALYRDSLNVVMLAGIPMAAGVWLIAPQLVTLLYGDGFEATIPVLQCLSLLVLAGFLRVIMEVFMTSCDRQSDLARYNLIVVVASIVLHYFMITAHGVTGAAVATLLSEMLLVGIIGWQLRHLFSWSRFLARSLIGIVATAAFMAPFLVLRDTAIFITIPASVLIYCAVLAMFGTIRRNELHLLLVIAGLRKERPAV